MLKIFLIETDFSTGLLIKSRIPDYCVLITLNKPEQLKEVIKNTEPDAVILGPSVSFADIQQAAGIPFSFPPLLIFNRNASAEAESPDDAEVMQYPENLGGIETFCEKLTKQQLHKASRTPSYELNQQLSSLVGESRQIHEVKEQIVKYSAASGPVLITGESGTGKDITARLIHNLSNRSGKFHAVNAGGISKELSGAELFGAAQGAYTGAVKREGCFEYADQGTLFLDEIGELELSVQAELLRVLEAGKVRRLGTNIEKEVDVRFLSATNRDPASAVRGRHLREDLLYRIDMFRIDIPPLRERKEDIPDLIMHFSRQLAKEKPNKYFEFTDEYFDRLFEYEWPGNVRELRNVFARSVYNSDDGRLSADCINF